MRDSRRRYAKLAGTRRAFATVDLWFVRSVAPTAVYQEPQYTNNRSIPRWATHDVATASGGCPGLLRCCPGRALSEACVIKPLCPTIEADRNARDTRSVSPDAPGRPLYSVPNRVGFAASLQD
jgi:hypothetical protein